MRSLNIKLFEYGIENMTYYIEERDNPHELIEPIKGIIGSYFGTNKNVTLDSFIRANKNVTLGAFVRKIQYLLFSLTDLETKNEWIEKIAVTTIAFPVVKTITPKTSKYYYKQTKCPPKLVKKVRSDSRIVITTNCNSYCFNIAHPAVNTVNSLDTIIRTRMCKRNWPNNDRKFKYQQGGKVFSCHKYFLTPPDPNKEFIRYIDLFSIFVARSKFTIIDKLTSILNCTKFTINPSTKITKVNYF